MATDDEIFALFTDEVLLGRIQAENMKMANAIIQEANTVANHPNRYRWALYVFRNPNAAASRMLSAVISNGDIQGGDISDATVAYVVNFFTDALADMHTAELIEFPGQV